MNWSQAVVTLMASANGLIFFRFVWKGLRALFVGVTKKEADVLTSALEQRDDAFERLEVAEEERDIYRRQVARRDYIILSHNLPLPNDGEDTIVKRRRLS